MADKFRLIMNNSARSKEEIAKELKRIIDLKSDRPKEKTVPKERRGFSAKERDTLTDAVKKAVMDKISSIVREAIETAREEKSYGEKIPPRQPRDNVDYLGEKPSAAADELAYAPTAYDDGDEGGEIRAKITEMRKLGQTFYNGYMLRQCAEETLVKQGEYMKDVTDDYGRSCFCGIERPIYGAMSTEQLRTYFTWRTYARRGIYSSADKPYIMLYCYELLNKIGVLSSADAYNRLSGVWENCRSFCPALNSFMPRWLKDFRAFNNIGEIGQPCAAEELSDGKNGSEDSAILNRQYSGKLEFIMGRSSYNLKGSIFFSEETAPLLDGALEAALTALDEYFSERGITLFELVCGRLKKDFGWEPFAGAYVDLDRMDGFHSLKISPVEQYCTKRGQPCLERFEAAPYRNFAGWVLKSVEAVLRKRTGFRYSISPNITPVLEDMTNRDKLFRAVSAPEFPEIISKAVEQWCDKKGIFPPKKQKKRSQGYNFDEAPGVVRTAPEPVEIDVSKLEKIREESDETTRKLIVEESEAVTAEEVTRKIEEIEADGFEEQAAELAEDYSREAPDFAAAEFEALGEGWRELASALTAEDIALIEALLAGSAEAHCRNRGVMPETEYDRVNSAAMEYIGDVLIENGAVIEDYRADAEEIVSLREEKAE